MTRTFHSWGEIKNLLTKEMFPFFDKKTGKNITSITALNRLPLHQKWRIGKHLVLREGERNGRLIEAQQIGQGRLW